MLVVVTVAVKVGFRRTGTVAVVITVAVTATLTITGMQLYLQIQLLKRCNILAFNSLFGSSCVLCRPNLKIFSFPSFYYDPIIHGNFTFLSVQGLEDGEDPLQKP